jgi:N-acetylmuramic acid 6-phosphate etherase
LGCLAIALTNNPASEMVAVAQLTIAPVVGPEVIMGSSRMKAGTAQKLVLNMLSTGAMIKLGKVYTNLMVDMQATNAKLKVRAVRMVMIATNVDEATAAQALTDAEDHAKTAIVSLLAGVSAPVAAAALSQNEGFVRQAIETAKAGAK